jgi:hypothetical protein
LWLSLGTNQAQKTTPGDLVDGTYNDWATKVWGNREFIRRSVVKDEVVALTRQRSATIRVRELDKQWGSREFVCAEDKLVPAIRWVTLVVSQPLLVEINRPNSTIRLLLVPDAPLVLDKEGLPRPSASQLDFMMVERIMETANCKTYQAKMLKRTVHDKWSLQIFGYAAHLLKTFGYNQAKATVDQLWDRSPDQTLSDLPSQFQVLAVDDQLHSMKIKAGLHRCLDLMVSWR